MDGVATQLATAVGKAPAGFFASLPFVADLSESSECTVAQLQILKQQFQHHGLTLIGVANHRCPPEVLVAAGLADIQFGQAALKKLSVPEAPANTAPPPPRPASNAKIVRQHVRSGQRVYAKGCDLVVIGTVGAGAEIIADGHISVYGSLRGRAFAGAKGERECFIFCSELSAELVSIAGCYQNMEQLEAYKGHKNCLITLDSDELMSVRSLMS